MKTWAVLSAILYCSICQSDGQACQSTNQELVFVVGTTSGPSAWPSLINFVNRVIDGFANIGQSKTRVSFVRYIGRRPYVAFYLNLYDDKSSVIKAVAAVEYSNENTTEAGDLAAAIDMVRTEALYAATVRTNVWKTAVIVVDKLPPPTDSSRLRRSIGEAEVSGIELVAVGIGVDNLDLLHRIGRRGHNGTRQHRTTYVAERSQLDGIAAATTTLACFEGLPPSAMKPRETEKRDEYDTYLDTGVYPDASVDDEQMAAEEKRSHTEVAAVVVVIGALVLLMLTFATIVYCRRKVREHSEMKLAMMCKQNELTGYSNLSRRTSTIKARQSNSSTCGTSNSHSKKQALLAVAKFQPGPNAHKSLGIRPWVVADVNKT